MLTETDKALVRMGAYIAALEQKLVQMQAELVQAKASTEKLPKKG